MSKPKTVTATITNYGTGVLVDGTHISFFADVVNGVVDQLSATIQTPETLHHRRITRSAPRATPWSLLPA